MSFEEDFKGGERWHVALSLSTLALAPVGLGLGLVLSILKLAPAGVGRGWAATRVRAMYTMRLDLG